MSFFNVEPIMILLLGLFMTGQENEAPSDEIGDVAYADEDTTGEFIFEEYFDDCITRTINFNQDLYDDSFSDLMLPVRDAIISGRNRYPMGSA